MFYKYFSVVLFLIGCLQCGSVRGATAFDVELKSALNMQQGLGWPHVLTVVEGHEALMKLTVTAEHQHSCTVVTPNAEVFNVSTPPSRFEAWGSGCGLRVRSVVDSDYGRWRLTSSGANQSYTGWIELYVEGEVSSYEAPPISLLDGATQAEVDLTSLDNSYCFVSQPFSSSSLVAGHCQVTLDKATRAVQGNWNVVMGLPGRIDELHVDRQVIVEAERLHVGYIHDSNTNKIHLYCNILDTNRNVTFCRFQKTTDVLGYNVAEGLSDGVHSYYGDGYVAKQCGMTIESPKAADFATWRCSVGSQQWVGNRLEQQAPMQALVNIPAHLALGSRNQLLRSVDSKKIFVQKDFSFTVMCHAEVSLSYCWFLHPNGTQYSPVTQTSEKQLFWYTGESLQTGDCGITFTHAQEADAGDWTCHMGASEQSGIEITDVVTLRVTGPLAAYDKQVGAVIGRNATIRCHTANGNKPLDYCRFLSPKFLGFNLDETVTEKNAIMGRFYFPPNSYKNQGDCSLNIISVREEDIGEWTCAALINNELIEAIDAVQLYAEKAPLTRASIIGMVFGIVLLLSILGGVIWYKSGLPLPKLNRRSENTQIIPNLNELNYDTMSYGYSERPSVATNGSSDSESGNNDGNEATRQRHVRISASNVTLRAYEPSSSN